MKRFTDKFGTRNIAQLIIILMCAFGLKQFYSTASVNELRWILAPTTFLVEAITGTSFKFEYYAGYINSDHSFIIAASCAGVNFLLTAFLMLSLGQLWRARTQIISCAFIPAAAGVSYLATLVANTVRICVAIWLRTVSSDITWIDQEQLHRLEGIVVYFGFLALLYFSYQKYWLRLRELKSDRNGGSRRSILYDFRFPLLIYYAIALGIPLITAAYRQRALPVDFREHLLFVLIIPVLIVVPWECVRQYQYSRETANRPSPTQLTTRS